MSDIVNTFLFALVLFAAFLLLSVAPWSSDLVSFLKNRKALKLVFKQKTKPVTLHVLYEVSDNKNCFLMLDNKFLTAGERNGVSFVNTHNYPVTMKTEDVQEVKQLLELLSSKQVSIDYTRNIKD